jgi:hypothetical protein
MNKKLFPLLTMHISAAALLCTAFLTGCGPAYPDYSYDNYPGGWRSEDTYWRDQYRSEPYYTSGLSYEVYQPAYYYGVESYHRHQGQHFNRLSEAQMRADWEKSHHDSKLDWRHAHQAIRAGYDHAERQDRHGDAHDRDDHHDRHHEHSDSDR